MARFLAETQTEQFSAVVTYVRASDPEAPYLKEGATWVTRFGPYDTASTAKGQISREQSTYHGNRWTVTGHVERTPLTWERI